MFGQQTLSFLLGLCTGLVLLSSPAWADWDTVPPLRAETALRIQPIPPTPKEEKEELDALDEKAKEYGAVERYLAAEGGYYIRNYSFAPSGQGEYQAFLFGQVDLYGVLVRLDYLRQFSSNAFGFEVGGHYYIHPDVRTGLNIRFSPKETLIERQGYAPFIEAGFLDRRLVARLVYEFRDFAQADLHEGELELDIHIAPFLTISPLYRISYVRPGGAANQTNHGLRLKIVGRPIAGVSVYGRYAFVQQDFEAAAPTPFDGFRAQEFGGGVEAILGFGAGLYFDFVYHDRNNGESFQQYNLGTFFRF